LAFLKPWIAGSCYEMVAVMWLIPDRRIERRALGEPLFDISLQAQ
jgi:hypothetical protein